jgi:hypothetical protein
LVHKTEIEGDQIKLDMRATLLAALDVVLGFDPEQPAGPEHPFGLDNGRAVQLDDLGMRDIFGDQFAGW